MYTLFYHPIYCPWCAVVGPNWPVYLPLIYILDAFVLNMHVYVCVCVCMCVCVCVYVYVCVCGGGLWILAIKMLTQNSLVKKCQSPNCVVQKCLPATYEISLTFQTPPNHLYT